MSYAVKSDVSAISKKALSTIDDAIIALADSQVESVIGYDMDAGLLSRTQYFDIERRNEFYVEYDGKWNFVLDKFPVASIIRVTIDPYGTPEILTADLDYWFDSESGVLKINDGVAIHIGQRALKVEYTWGYASVPQDVKNYASWLAAFFCESTPNIPTNDSGHILAEVEIGRFREKYDNASQALKSKYAILNSLRDDIETRYKIWG